MIPVNGIKECQRVPSTPGFLKPAFLKKSPGRIMGNNEVKGYDMADHKN